MIRNGRKRVHSWTQSIERLADSIHDKSPIAGLTHLFYRYPARFSPRFAEAAIRFFTKPGEIVYDPFMGGGTTLVEAMRLGRRSIGSDLNNLAVFVSRAKTTLYTDDDISSVRAWVDQAHTGLKLTETPMRPVDWIQQGYQKNISGRTTWQIRKTIELALANLESLDNDRQKDFIRCLILKTAQWAVDCREHHPSANEFRRQLMTHAEEMIAGALELRREVQLRKNAAAPICINLSAKDIAYCFNRSIPSSPRLILTSPPYPGVHVLYHRWQVNGRKETPAPYWIANCLDGHGASFYTFGDRNQKNLEGSFENMRESYKALSAIAKKNTWLVQLVAFSAPEWQLPSYLEILQQCGFDELLHNDMPQAINGRSWRTVPNRKFYAGQKGSTPSSKEVLLIHRRS
jgi:hypothetical protein